MDVFIKEQNKEILNYIPAKSPEDLLQLRDQNVTAIIQEPPKITHITEQVALYGVKIGSTYVRITDILNSVDEEAK
jgi:hypothetical protein